MEGESNAMKKIILTILMFAAGCAYALDFKGIELGVSRSDDSKVMETFDEIGKSCMPHEEDTMCWGNTSIAGEFGSVNLFADSDNVIYLLIVSFDASGYNSVSKALATKFGAGAKTSQNTLSNQLGAKVLNVTKEWTLGKCSVKSEKYFGKIDRSAVIYHCPTPARERAIKSHRQKSEKDL